MDQGNNYNIRGLMIKAARETSNTDLISGFSDKPEKWGCCISHAYHKVWIVYSRTFTLIRTEAALGSCLLNTFSCSTFTHLYLDYCARNI